MRRTIASCLLLAAIVLSMTSTARSEPASKPIYKGPVPQALSDWIAWVENRDAKRVCVPGSNDERWCEWPGRIRLELLETGGSFELGVFVAKREEIALPGGEGVWPVEVTEEGSAAVPVLAREGVPHAVLDAGFHRLTGKFAWTELPRNLVVPEALALVQLQVRGTAIAEPKRQGGKL